MRGNSTISNRCRCHRTAAVDHRTSCRWRPPYAIFHNRFLVSHSYVFILYHSVRLPEMQFSVYFIHDTFSLSVRMIFNELAECFIGYPPFDCLLSPPFFEQRDLFFALYILITFQFGADEHFSSHSAKTSQNKLILDISRVTDGIQKTQQAISDLLR